VKNWYALISNIDYEILQWKGNAPKNIASNPLSSYMSSPGAREPISVANLLNLLRKRTVMADVNVSNVGGGGQDAEKKAYHCC
jgi:hypothetical protein